MAYLDPATNPGSTATKVEWLIWQKLSKSACPDDFQIF